MQPYIDIMALLFHLTTEHVKAGKTILCGPRYRITNSILTQGRVRLTQGRLGKAPLYNQAFVVGNRNIVPDGV